MVTPVATDDLVLKKLDGIKLCGRTQAASTWPEISSAGHHRDDALLRLLGDPPQRHVLQHRLLRFGHGWHGPKPRREHPRAHGPGPPGAVQRALSVFRSKLGLYGTFVWARRTQRPKMAGFRRAGQLGLTIEPTGAFPPSFVLSEGWLLPGSLESAVALLEREGWDGLAVDNEDLVPKRGTVIKRNAGSVPPWPPNDVPGPNATCQARVDGWCTQHCFDEIAGHMPSCGDGPMVARCSGAADHPGSAWRCYGVSTLSPDRARYVNGSCFCSMTAGIEAALAQCDEPKPPGPCGAVGPPGPPPPPSPGPQPAAKGTLPEMFNRLLGNLTRVMTAANKTVVTHVTNVMTAANIRQL